MPRNHSNRRKAHDSADNARRGPARPPRRGGKGRDSGGADGGPLWIWGTHAVAAALANPARTCHELLATENAAQRLPAGAVQPVIVSAKDIDSRLPDGAVHQGVAVKVDPLEPVALEDLIDAGVSHIAVLDQVSDPHNLGAVYRSAAAFGFGGLVLQTRNAPNVTGVAAKAAVGAIETVREARVVNIARALEQLAEAGYHTVGLAGEGQRLIAEAVEGAPKLAIVLGAEGPGIRPAVAKACAELARIPIAPEMESLNVSNAAAVAFYESNRNRFPLS
ncbi:TrmH family RNA methyltransferase [Hyphomonas atlantica]|uniref:TrmH family RNA methyltransferase n=1 Tax=Hyphomonas atlantica TaxID=1280948 RepID=UPI0032B0F9D3